MSQLNDDLRKQAAALMATAKKLLEAASAYEEIAGPVKSGPIETQPPLIPATPHVRRNNQPTTIKTMIVEILTQSGPLGRNEIFAKLADLGHPVKIATLSSILSRLCNADQKLDRSDSGKWSMKP